MNVRLLSACLAATILVGMTDRASAQSAGKPAKGPAGGPAAKTATATPAADADVTTPAAEDAPFGSTAGTPSKDPFDQAAAREKHAATGGDSTGPRLEKATFGAGCFWHVEAEFEWLPGVKSAVSGYSGGFVPNPSYEMVHEGETGHAEVVQVEYDPAVITYEQLLGVFWRGHDPTQLNRQGPDVGTQYRSVIFYHNEAQRKAALKSYQQLVAARAYSAPIVTQLVPMKAFYRAEEYHQNYYGGKPDRPTARSTRARRSARPPAKKAVAAKSAKIAAGRKGVEATKDEPAEETRASGPASTPSDPSRAEP